MTLKQTGRMILTGAAAATAFAGCLFLSPDEKDSTIELRIEASIVRELAGDGRSAAAPCTILTELDTDSELLARATVRVVGTGESLATKTVPVTYDPSSDSPLTVPDLEVPRAGPDDTYEVELELFYQGDDAEGIYSGTIESRGTSGLGGCVRSLTLTGGTASVLICAAGVETPESRRLILNADLRGTYADTIPWPPGDADAVDTDVVVEMALALLPVRIAVGTAAVSDLRPGAEARTISIELVSPPDPPNCPGETGEQLAGTLTLSFKDDLTEPAIADILLERNAACGCCSDCD